MHLIVKRLHGLSDDMGTAAATSLLYRSNGDLNFEAQVVEVLKKPFHRKPLELAAHQCRNFRLVQPHNLGRLRLRELPRGDGLTNLMSQFCLDKPVLWVAQGKIRENIVAALLCFFDFISPFHYAIFSMAGADGQAAAPFLLNDNRNVRS